MATPLDFPIPSAGDSLLADSYVSSQKAASKASPAVGSVHDLAISPPRDRPALSFPELAVRLSGIHFTPALIPSCSSLLEKISTTHLCT